MGGERHIGQGGVLMPALIKRPRAPLTCNNQLTCLKRHFYSKVHVFRYMGMKMFWLCDVYSCVCLSEGLRVQI